MTPTNTTTPPIEVPDTAREMVDEAKKRWRSYFPTLTYGSLFSGIEGFGVGFEKSGMECLWRCEKDQQCRTLLADKWKDVPIYEDVREVTGVARPDVICGGFPCQDLSVAGRRKGLAGERSGLWFEFLRVLEETKPRWTVIENVPGLLSSHGGRDFAVLLHGLVSVGYRVSWRVLDAQYFGVAQRRRRVFIVGSLGDGSAAEILFECEGVRWHPPTRRKKGEEVAATAREGASRHIPDISRPCFAAQGTKWNGNGALEESLIAGTLAANGGGLNRPAGNCNETDFCIPIQYAEQWGRDKRQNGVGNPDAVDAPCYTLDASYEHGVAMCLNSRNERYDGESLTFAVVTAETTPKHGEICPALDSVGSRRPPVAFDWQSGGDVRHNVSENHISALQASQTPAIMHPLRAGRRIADSYGDAGNVVPSMSSVRRLTPLECERLQGFPDHWTAAFPDSVRYRMLGNAVAVPVAEWLGRRIAMAAETDRIRTDTEGGRRLVRAILGKEREE